MNRNTVILALAALVILAVLGGYLVARSNQVGNAPATTTSNTSTSPQPNQQGSAAAQQSVGIKNMAFTPASITIKKGATVTWANDDMVSHNIVETDGQTGPDSSTIAPGGTYAFTYNAAGTFHYHCSIHPNMTGTVVVTE